MGKRQRMITDEVLCSTKFLNMHKETQLLYIFLILYSDDDGIVDPFPIMKMISITNLATIEELINKEYLYQVDDDGTIYYIVHFRAQNKIRPSRKIDSLYLPQLIKKHPELIGNITISKNPKCPDSFSHNLEKVGKLETVSKIPTNWSDEYNITNNSYIIGESSLPSDDDSPKYTSMPPEIKAKCELWKKQK